jgi:hypothetical protein
VTPPQTGASRPSAHEPGAQRALAHRRVRLGHRPAPGDGAAWVIDQVVVTHRPQRPGQQSHRTTPWPRSHRLPGSHRPRHLRRRRGEGSRGGDPPVGTEAGEPDSMIVLSRNAGRRVLPGSRRISRPICLPVEHSAGRVGRGRCLRARAVSPAATRIHLGKHAPRDRFAGRGVGSGVLDGAAAGELTSILAVRETCR